MNLLAKHIDNYTRSHGQALVAWVKAGQYKERIEKHQRLKCRTVPVAGEVYDLIHLGQLRNSYNGQVRQAIHHRNLCCIAAKTLHELGIKVEAHEGLLPFSEEDLMTIEEATA